MTDEFIEWLNECPISWLLIDIDADNQGRTYKFFIQIESDD